MQRWSRLKADAGQTSPAPAAPQAGLPALESLTPESDFSAFMQPDVDATTRQTALKKLFMTEHYRNMDMLDVYVDDYSKPELLPAGMLATLHHAIGVLNSKPAADDGQKLSGEESVEQVKSGLPASGSAEQPTKLNSPSDGAATAKSKS
jgi:hypothetical protein